MNTVSCGVSLRGRIALRQMAGCLLNEKGAFDALPIRTITDIVIIFSFMVGLIWNKLRVFFLCFFLGFGLMASFICLGNVPFATLLLKNITAKQHDMIRIYEKAEELQDSREHRYAIAYANSGLTLLDKTSFDHLKLRADFLRMKGHSYKRLGGRENLRRSTDCYLDFLKINPYRERANLIVIENHIMLDEYDKALDHVAHSLGRVETTDVINMLNCLHVVLKICKKEPYQEELRKFYQYIKGKPVRRIFGVKYWKWEWLLEYFDKNELPMDVLLAMKRLIEADEDYGKLEKELRKFRDQFSELGLQ